MKPLRITMEAFGSYAAPKTIDFTVPKQNIFLITGETGAGKSMIFDALVFALYGEASSEQYKKAGVELQSQLVEGKPPTVTLVFEQRPGEIYTIIRKGSYIRKKRNGDPKREQGSVELIDPDGAAYADQKETDKKIEELVGLDKSQFMQVAMIAQGEFVQLLRTKSDARKEIFRKLFGTRIYQDMTDELKNRAAEKNAVIREIKSGFVNHAAALRYPEDIPDKEGLDEVAGRIRSADKADKVTDTDLERFAALLPPLCQELERRYSAAGEELKKLSERRDISRDALKSADELIKHFAELDAARSQLSACEAEKEGIEKAKLLECQITSAWEIDGAFKLYAQAAKAAADVRNGLKKCSEELPGLEEKCSAAAAAEAAAKAAAERTSAEAARITEQVKAALAAFEKINDAGKEVSCRLGLLKKADQAAADADKAYKAHGEHIKALREKESQLTKDTAELPVFEKHDLSLGTAEGTLEEARTESAETAKLEKALAAAEKSHAAAEKACAQAEEEYTHRRDAFIHNQAGFIALELRNGTLKECPVCGSTQHPRLAVLPEDAADLKREDIDRLEAVMKRRQAELSKASDEKNARQTELTLHRQRFSDAMKKVNDQLSKLFKSVDRELSLSEAGELVRDRRAALNEKLALLRDEAARLESIRAELADADGKSESLEEKLRLRTAEAAEARTEYEKACSTRDALGQGLAYPSAGEAAADRSRAQSEGKKAAAAHTAALSALDRSRSDRDRCSALINKYTAELPEKESSENERLEEYRAVMEKHSLTEEQWQQITREHERSEAERLRARISDFAGRLSSAGAKAEIAEEITKGKTRPDAEKLRSEYEAAEESLASITGEHKLLSSMLDTDRRIFEAVSAGSEERRELIRSCRAAERLYARLKGSRFDIETYVQRWHLEQALVAANRRFLEMTGGELELHICDEDYLSAADKRSPHGLQIMAYSTFTGKQREVSTLSGGETFMAALSLALGIGDRIKAGSAAVSPDILFIDEGFGSLSSHARHQAVKILKRLAGGTKLIGLISHVSELQKEIDDKLTVTRTERGSDAVWTE